MIIGLRNLDFILLLLNNGLEDKIMSDNNKSATNNQWVTASSASCACCANCGCKSKKNGHSMIGNFDSVDSHCGCNKEK